MADWEQHGKLVLVKDGKIFIGTEDIVGISFRVRELVDLNLHTPEPKVAPAWATKW
ncbi:MAG: hypothetical protein JXA33_06595 [Anaerolineae bacterium]|nr:hypothetical protein [Anaerolineae bacterium]